MTIATNLPTLDLGENEAYRLALEALDLAEEQLADVVARLGTAREAWVKRPLVSRLTHTSKELAQLKAERKEMEATVRQRRNAVRVATVAATCELVERYGLRQSYGQVLRDVAEAARLLSKATAREEAFASAIEAAGLSWDGLTGRCAFPSPPGPEQPARGRESPLAEWLAEARALGYEP